MVDVRRRSSQRFGNDTADLLERFRKGRIVRRVFLRERRDGLRRLTFVLIERERLAVRRKRRYARVGRNEAGAVLFQLQVAHDRRQYRPGTVRKSGAAKAGMEFVSDGSAANLRAPFEHE